MSVTQASHLAFELLAAVACLLAGLACLFAVWQWRFWQREAEEWKRLAEEAERTSVGALAVARHCHERMQRAVADAEAMLTTTHAIEEVRELQ